MLFGLLKRLVWRKGPTSTEELAAELTEIDALAARNDVAAAIVRCQAARAHCGDLAPILARQGMLYLRQGATEEARTLLESALDKHSGLPEAAEPLFQLLVQHEDYSAALALAENLIEREPDNGRWWRMKGFLLFKRYYDPDTAERCYAKAEAMQGDDAAFWVERGICARDRGDLAKAVACFNKALSLSPEHPLARFHRGLTHLYAENYAEGWSDYAARFADANLRAVRLPGRPWSGEPLAGSRLVVAAEQGLGDEIMFASCFGDLPRDGPVTVGCSARLLPIFRASFPEIEFVDKEIVQAMPADERQWAIAAGSLPGLYRPTRESFPRQPYLRASEAGREKARAYVAGLPPGRRIGISWRGGTEASRRRLRTLGLDDLVRLLKIPGISWVSLQYGDCGADLRQLEKTHGISLCHPQALLDDYDATAALVEQLDFVVTVCTSIAHLAGALGKEVWVLAPKVPEWRYGLAFRFMPWYRQVEVLRQTSAGDWSGPLDEVARRLAAA